MEYSANLPGRLFLSYQGHRATVGVILENVRHCEPELVEGVAISLEQVQRFLNPIEIASSLL